MKLIILDFDGTLADTRGVIVRTMQRTIAALGLPVRTDDECAAVIGLPLAACFDALYPGITADVAARGADTYRQIFREEVTDARVPLFPHVDETLRSLRAMGYTLTIASSRSRTSLMHFVADMRLDDVVTYVLGADDVTRHKPDPEPVLQTLRHFGITTAGEALADVWVVGDMTFDILMGRRAGVRTVGVTYGNGSRGELLDAGADHVVDDFGELRFIVAQTDFDNDPLPEGHFVRSH